MGPLFKGAAAPHYNAVEMLPILFNGSSVNSATETISGALICIWRKRAVGFIEAKRMACAITSAPAAAPTNGTDVLASAKLTMPHCPIRASRSL